MELAPDMSEFMDTEEQDFVIKVFHGEKEIINLPAKATSLEDLREQYVKTFGRISTPGKDVSVKVYRKDANGDLHLVAEHLF